MKIVNGRRRYKGVRMAVVRRPRRPSSPTRPPRITAAEWTAASWPPGTTKPADAGSSYNSPYNQIVFVVKTSDLGLATGDTINGFNAGAGQSTDPTNTGTGATQLYDMMPDSLAYTGSYTVVDNNSTCSVLQNVVSRKTHGTAGTFDIPMPLAGHAGIELPRHGTAGVHTLIFTLDRAVNVAGTVSVLPSGNGTAALGPNANQVTISLTGIPNAQHIFVTLNNVQDMTGAVLSNLTSPMDVLLGDVNATGRVDSSDVSLTRQQTLHPVTTSNFRQDPNASGRIDSSDVSIVRQQTLTALP